MDSDAPPVPEPPIKREASSPTRVPPDAPRRKLKTQPPPPPGSPARKALEDKILELRGAYDEADAAPAPPASPAGRPPPAPPRPPRVATGASPVATGKARAPRTGDAPDMSSLPEADRTKENRGAVGIKHDRSASLTANAASGTIGETPAPLFDRAAIAAGQRGAVASERVTDRATERTTDRPRQSPGDARHDARNETRDPTPNGRLGSPPGDAVPARPQDRSPSGRAAHAGSGPTAGARGSGAIADRPARAASPRPAPPARPAGSRDDRDDHDDDDDDDDRDDDAPSGPPGAGDPARRTVPVGEFDHGETVLEQDKLRVAHAQATIKRDAASALLGIAAPAPARMPAAEVLFDEPTRKRGETGFDEPTRKRGDPGFDEPTRRTADPGSDGGSNEAPNRGSNRGSREALAAFNDASGSSTGRFERGDPTFGDARGDATAISAPATGAAATGTLRSSAALPRRRGVAGDLRYVATVVIGLRRARREIAELTGRQATRQQSRRHHLVTLGRAAVTADGFEHPALDAARDQLATIEDERSQHAGHVVAADAELMRVRRDRDAKAKKYADDIAALDVELAGLTRKLEPLDKEVAGGQEARRRSARGAPPDRRQDRRDRGQPDLGQGRQARSRRDPGRDRDAQGRSQGDPERRAGDRRPARRAEPADRRAGGRARRGPAPARRAGDRRARRSAPRRGAARRDRRQAQGRRSRRRRRRGAARQDPVQARRAALRRPPRRPVRASSRRSTRSTSSSAAPIAG